MEAAEVEMEQREKRLDRPTSGLAPPAKLTKREEAKFFAGASLLKDVDWEPPLGLGLAEDAAAAAFVGPLGSQTGQVEGGAFPGDRRPARPD